MIFPIDNDSSTAKFYGIPDAADLPFLSGSQVFDSLELDDNLPSFNSWLEEIHGDFLNRATSDRNELPNNSIQDNDHQDVALSPDSSSDERSHEMSAN